MNDIIFAGDAQDRGAEAFGTYILCPDMNCVVEAGGRTLRVASGEVAVVPRGIDRTGGRGRAVVIKNALSGLKEACVIGGIGARDVSEACSAAVRYRALGNDAVIKSLGHLIVALVGTYCGGNTLSPAVKSVLAEIERGLSDPLFSLEGAIRALPLNYDYVRKLFRREVGATPLEYLTSARMERAAAIIASGVQNRYSNYTVAQIAEMCGYSEPLYFSRVFKNYYGLSPSQYIERARRGR